MAVFPEQHDRLDTLIGAKEIAAFSGLKIRQVFSLLERGELPAVKIGRLWISSKSRIKRRLEPAEA